MSPEDSPKSSKNPWHVKVFSALMGCAVALGAFGAHALKSSRTEVQLESWKTATLYLFIHGVAGLALSLYDCCRRSQSNTEQGGVPPMTLKLLLSGSLIFSGSLYLLVLLQFPMLGAVTPLGGAAMILGWLVLVLKFRT